MTDPAREWPSNAKRMAEWRARQVAAGRKIVRGYAVDEPRLKRRKGEEPPHGTYARYRWSYGPCRCPECTAANAAHTSNYKRRRRG